MTGDSYGASVWKIPELYGQSNSPQLEQLFTLDEHTAKIRWCVLVSVKAMFLFWSCFNLLATEDSFLLI